jgi:hypothetical protein
MAQEAAVLRNRYIWGKGGNRQGYRRTEKTPATTGKYGKR